MKKLLIIALAGIAFSAFAGMETLDDQDATKVGLPSLVTKVNANFTELYDTANAASTSAAAAQSTADAASSAAAAAQSTADAASSAAADAQSTADDASASAAAAQSTADAVSAVAATALQPADVWGSPGITTSTVAAVATAAIQAKTLAGGSLTGYRVIHVWLSDTSMGEASTNNVTSLVLSGGTAVATVTAECDYWYLTGSDGTASAAVTGEAAIDKYIMVGDGSSVSAAKITFEP